MRRTAESTSRQRSSGSGSSKAGCRRGGIWQALPSVSPAWRSSFWGRVDPGRHAEARVLSRIELELPAIENFPAEDDGLDVPRLRNVSIRRAADRGRCRAASGAKGSPFAFRAHEPGGVARAHGDRLEGGEARLHEELELAVQSFALEDPRIGSVGPCREKDAGVEELLGVD